MGEMTMRWFIARTFAGAEWQAHKGLLRRGVKSYLPYMLADMRRGRWYQAAIKPQFPTYLFAGLEPGESTQAVASTSGVHALLRIGGELVTVSPGELATIKAQCNERRRGTLPALTDVRRWKVGDYVPVPYGPMEGAPVQITAIDKSGRIVASIGNFGAITFHVEAKAELERMAYKTVRGSA